MFGLTNKNAVVTGAGSGIGKAVALVLARQGAHVTIVDINKAEAEAVVKEIEGAGGKAAAVAVDVSDQGKVDAAFAGLASLDILVNSAGVSHIGTAESTSEADFDRLYKVNVKGVYNCLHAAIPVMKRRASGGTDGAGGRGA
jgi:2-keto-3-deoxy-L-fuconate dehydrogenase